MSDAESFPTPDHPEDMIIQCEGCNNYLYVRNNLGRDVLDCPLCGCLNSTAIRPSEKIEGRIVLKSPVMEMNLEAIEGGKISLPELPEQVQKALLWLQNHRWRFGFMIEEDPEDPAKAEDQEL